MRRYHALLRAPSGTRLAVAGVFTYVGQAALGIVVLLSVHQVSGSFTIAGVAGGILTVAFSISTIIQARRIDAHGPRVLLRVGATSITTTLAMDLALEARAGAVILCALAGAVGLSVPAAGASLRTVWAGLLDDADARATASAYQSLAQDAGFVAGPAVLGTVAALSSVAALSTCAALLAAGAWIVATTPVHAAPVQASCRDRDKAALGAVAVLALVLLAVGLAVGSVDISAAAFASDHGRSDVAGSLLAAFALGSIGGGAAYGGRRWRSAPEPRLVCCLVALGFAGTAPILATGVWFVGPALLFAGLPLAATLTTAYILVGERAPQGRETEAYALASLTLNAGSALGGALSGILVAGDSARPGFILAAASPLTGAGMALLVFRRTKLGYSRRGSSAPVALRVRDPFHASVRLLLRAAAEARSATRRSRGMRCPGPACDVSRPHPSHPQEERRGSSRTCQRDDQR